MEKQNSTYSESVFVVLVIQLAKRMLRIMSSVACPALQYFSTLSHIGHDFGKKSVIEHKVFWFDFFYKSCLKHFSFEAELARYNHNVHSFLFTVPVINVRF